MSKELSAVLLCHRNYLDKKLNYRDGGSDDLLSIFSRKYLFNFSHDEYTSIKESIISITKKNNNKLQIVKIFKKQKLNFVIFNIYKFLYLLKYLKKLKTNFVISADSYLCFLSIFLNFFSFEKKIIIFHITDLSDKRFNNYILKNIYNFFFKISCSYSDYISCPSKKILKKIGYKKKSFFIPNSPLKIRKKINTKKKNNAIISLVNIDEGTDWDLIYKSLKLVVLNKPNFKLYVTGNIKTAYSKKILQKFNKSNLKKNISFVGYLSKNKLYKLYDKCKFGLTAYKSTKKHTYWHYGDSIKIREYAESGLIILTEGLYYNSFEVKKLKLGKIYKNYKQLAKYFAYFNKFSYTSKDYIQRSRNWAIKNRKEFFLKKFKYKINQDFLVKI